MIIRDSELSIDRLWFRFEMNNITISERKCPVALSVINSHRNMLLVNIPSGYNPKLILTGNTYFLSNHGSVLLLSGSVKFEGCFDFW